MINVFLIFIFLTFLPFNILTDQQKQQIHRQKASRSSTTKRPSAFADFSERRKETTSLLKKLHDSLWKISESQLDREFNWEELNEQFTKIRTNLGSGFDVVVYNCTHPTYITLDAKKQAYVNASIANRLKTEDECSARTGHVWRLKSDLNYLSTLDVANNSLTSDLLPFSALAEVFDFLKLCDQFLYFMRHPSVFLKNYKRPSKCSARNSTQHFASNRS